VSDSIIGSGQTVIGFLKTYALDEHFKLNIEPNHTTLAGHDLKHDILVVRP
jgi:xylose isomerase